MKKYYNLREVQEPKEEHNYITTNKTSEEKRRA